MTETDVVVDNGKIISETFRLYGWADQLEEPVRSILYGIMFDKAKAIITHFPSDMYHDALWLSLHVLDEITFYWGPRSWGSFIGFDPSLVYAGGMPEGLEFYRVEVHRQNHDPKSGSWCATFTRVDPVTAPKLEAP